MNVNFVDPARLWQANGYARKSNNLSQWLRELGNQFYQRRKFYEALIYYNKAVANAEPGEDVLALAYANRAAVYCEIKMYQKALENIELAFQNNYPAEKKKSLDTRAEKCKDALKFASQAFDPWTFFKLSHDPNVKIPFIIDSMQLIEKEGGEHEIFTTSNLAAGDIIAIESPLFVGVSNDSTSRACAYCFKANDLSLIPCLQCSEDMYCSVKCRDNDTWHHNFDNFHSELGETLRLFKQSEELAGGVEGLLELLAETGKTVFDFDFSGLGDELRKKYFLIAVNTGLKHACFPEEIADVLTDKLHIPPFNDASKSPEERRALIKFVSNQLNLKGTKLHGFARESSSEDNPHIRIQLLGSGVFPFASLIRCSNESNVSFVTVDDKLVVVAKCPINAGEQIIAHNCDCSMSHSGNWKDNPKKDKKFVAPRVSQLISGEDAVKQFRQNCEYINKNFKSQPCFELSYLMKQNERLVKHISLNSLLFQN